MIIIFEFLAKCNGKLEIEIQMISRDGRCNGIFALEIADEKEEVRRKKLKFYSDEKKIGKSLLRR